MKREELREKLRAQHRGLSDERIEDLIAHAQVNPVRIENLVNNLKASDIFLDETRYLIIGGTLIVAEEVSE